MVLTVFSVSGSVTCSVRSGSTTEIGLLESGGGQERQEPPARCRARRGPMGSGQKPPGSQSERGRSWAGTNGSPAEAP